MGRRTISELNDIQFDGSIGEAMHEYGERLRGLSLRWAFEFEAAAGDAEAAMSSLDGRWWALGIDTKVRARKVARRLVRAQEMAHAMGDQGGKLHRVYLRHFPEASR
ncbi:hypothetical protein [Actinomadura sp. GTD37]|uniref:hypothetical protein n=1 Tax=Actinomadura sp. GTD37 TaxID=1778030 RepID=UPI0035BEBD1D